MFRAFVIIFGTIGLLTASSISDPAALQDFILTNLGLEYGEEALSDNAFHREFRLQSIVCPDSVRCAGVNYQLEADPLLAVKDFFLGCCLPCSCDADCFDIGNCCPEVESATTSGLNKTTIRGVKCIRPDIWTHILKNSDSNMGREVLMFTDCPHDFDSGDTNVSLKCREPDSMVLSQITPVTSLSTGRTYWNTYCAACNSDSERVAAWAPMVSFHSSISQIDTRATVLNSWETLATHFHQSTPRQMNLVFQHPASVERNVTTSVCPLKTAVVKQCNETGTWPKFDRFIEQACNSYSLPYETEREVFYNVFCFLCNPAPIKEHHGTASCRIDLTPYRFISYSMIGLIQFSAAANKPEEMNANGRCHCSEIWDSRKASCRPLLCPQMESRVGCECRQFIKPLSGAPMRLNLKLTPSTLTFSSMDTNFLRDLQTETNTILRHMLPNVSIDSSGLFAAYHNTTHYEYFTHTVVLKVNRGFDTKTTLRAALNMSFHVWSHHVSYYVCTASTIRFIDSLDAVVNLSDQTHLVQVFHRKGVYMYTFFLSKLVYCHQIALENDEYAIENHVLHLNATNGKSMHVFDFALSSESVKIQICVEDYLSAIQETSGSQTISTCIPTLFTACITVVLRLVCDILFG